jgi:hypothetical protein
VNDRIAADGPTEDAAAARVWASAETVAAVRASLERTVRR